MKQIYTLILAGGTGQRMGADQPKQFLEIGGRAIVSYTVEAFLDCGRVDRIIVLAPQEHMDHMKRVLKRDLGQRTDRVEIVPGGRLRNDTIMNGIKYIKENYPCDEETILLTHDAVRPFVTERIIEDNIRAMETSIACDTVIPATDTIVESLNGEDISSVPNRANLYQGQTPQTFRMIAFENLYSQLDEEEKNILTDAVKAFIIKGRKVAIVDGESSNIKVTYPIDLTVAEAILKERQK